MFLWTNRGASIRPLILRGVSPDRCRLFQAAVLICIVELLAVKHEKGLPLNKSEDFFFGKWRDFKKNYLAPLRRLSV